MLLDLVQAVLHCLPDQMVEGDVGSRKVIEQRFEPFVHQRQPVLHAGNALAGADGLIELVGGGDGAELGDVARAETPDRRFVERKLARRNESQAIDGLVGALRFGVELLDVLERVAEEVEPQGAGAARREDVDDAASDGVLAVLDDGAGAREARAVEEAAELSHVDALLRGKRLQRALDEDARGYALQDGIDGGDDDGRALALGRGEAGERVEALGHDLAVGRNAVVGHAVPGRKPHHAHLGREEAERGLQCLNAPVVANDMQEHGRLAARLLLLRRGDLAERQRVEPFGYARKHVRLHGHDCARSGTIHGGRAHGAICGARCCLTGRSGQERRAWWR